jgi:serine/threonine protein phosphatase PrpC
MYEMTVYNFVTPTKMNRAIDEAIDEAMAKKRAKNTTGVIIN